MVGWSSNGDGYLVPVRRGALTARVVLTLASLIAAFAVAVAPAGAAPKMRQFVGLTSDETFEQLGQGGAHNADDFVRLGAGTVRQTFDWSFLTFNQAPGQLNLLFTDRYMTAMAQRKIHVMPVLFNPPP